MKDLRVVKHEDIGDAMWFFVGFMASIIGLTMFLAIPKTIFVQVTYGIIVVLVVIWMCLRSMGYKTEIVELPKKPEKKEWEN